MTPIDFRGARSSNAGDDFHELWALRQSLALLDPDQNLVAVTVEGIRAEDETGLPAETWDGVDCAMYSGGESATDAERIDIAQLKYSAADPTRPWTVARLTHSTNAAQNNSVIARLARAFAGLNIKRPDLVASNQVGVQLISNQPIDDAVLAAVSLVTTASQNPASEYAAERARLIDAAGLHGELLVAFMRALNFDECGGLSRFAIEERVLTKISSWTEIDVRARTDDLLRFIRVSMMPEGKGALITKYSILARLDFSDMGALFPCPSVIKRVAQPVPRAVSQIVVQKMLNGVQRICLHGEAGCGKTTALQEIEGILPPGSTLVIFDCYGGGRYLDSDATRHRPQDAFLQLSNDLARLLRTPLLLSRARDLDYARVFKKRLDRAADIVAAMAQDALLVVVVDAADNSIVAANMSSRSERSFVSDFVLLGDLPANVRLMISTRTGRLPMLELPRDFASIQIEGFTPVETAVHIRTIWHEAPTNWIEDFHSLSGGNPRVQQYALGRSGTDLVRSIDYLRPDGKSLNEIFKELFANARAKVGREQDLRTLCSGLIGLPRPIPIDDLAVVTQTNQAHTRDLCADLAPGIRIVDQLISFADEDFEDYVRAEAEPQLGSMQARIADWLMQRRQTDPYAAMHVAVALLAANRGQEIIELVASEGEPRAIDDPVLRRETQLQRLRTAMKVCRSTGNNADAMMTLIVGAEALKTDAVIQRALIQSPDLAASFARDTASKKILRDSDEIEHHGPLLFHLMAVDARRADAISMREDQRQLGAWLQRRDSSYLEQKERHPNTRPQGWEIDDYDIAAETEAMLRIYGPERAIAHLFRWRPRRVALRTASILAAQLITSGEVDIVQQCLDGARVPDPWDLFVLTPLALSGSRYLHKPES